MGWPQILWVVMQALCVGICIVQGRALGATIGAGLQVGLLWWGGFFG